MWKGAIIFLLVTLAVGCYSQGSVAVPTLPNKYWGPGKSQPDPNHITPFKISVKREIINDLHERLDRALSTDRFAKPLEGVAWTYGMPSTYLKTVLKYWRNNYDWNKRQSLLNKYPQFTTKIQGLNIQFYHVKPQQAKDRKLRVLPLLMLHGWPGSIVEFQKIIPLLIEPSSDRDFVFELIIPSLPGYGFSEGASKPGLGPAQTGVIFKNLMERLGFNKFYVQGGDWGSIVASLMAALFPQRVIGLHSNICRLAESPRTVFLTLLGSYIPSLVIEDEHYSKMYPIGEHLSYLVEETGYVHIQATKPDTVGTGLTDSPAGLAAYILEKFSTWTNPEYRKRDDGGLLEKFTMDELLDNVMVYWITNSITTSQRLYAENFSKAYRDAGLEKIPITVPTACAWFPHELLYRPESILKERYANLIQFTHPPTGGHFAAFEEPQLLADDVWSFVQKNEQNLKLADNV